MKKRTENKEKRFESNLREYLAILFASTNIRNINNGSLMKQEHHVPTITKPTLHTKFEISRKRRYRLSWISFTRREILAGVYIIAQVTDETFHKEYVRITNSLIGHTHNDPKLGIQYKKIYF